MPPVFYPSLYDRPQEGGLSLAGYMTLLISVIMLPMLVLVTIIAWDYGTAARRTIEGAWSWRDLSKHYARVWHKALASSASARRVA